MNGSTRRHDVLVLARYLYWMRDRILDVAAPLPADEFVAGPELNGRNLRATLVHELDVEWSWRGRLRGEAEAGWGPESELRPEDFPTVAVLRDRWRADEQVMLEWLDGLSDEVLDAPPTVGGEGRLPLWVFLLHVLEHGVQQLTAAGAILSAEARSPGDIDFLDAVDAHGRDPELRS